MPLKPLTRTTIAFLMVAPFVVALSLTLDNTKVNRRGVLGTVQADSGSGDGGDAAERGGRVWGKIKRYTGSYVVVDRKTYHFAKNIVIDTYSLKKDDRGDVRLVLDEHGRVTHLFFYGIDMPDAIGRYKR